MMASLEQASCADVRIFTNLVRAQQRDDDNIAHTLNRPGVVRSAETCRDLFAGFVAAHQRRVGAIRRCAAELQARVDDLAKRAAVPGADPAIRSHLTAERAKVPARPRSGVVAPRGRQRSRACPLGASAHAERLPVAGAGTQLRHLATEVSAEDIVAERTVLMFRDRCSGTGVAFDVPGGGPSSA